MNFGSVWNASLNCQPGGWESLTRISSFASPAFTATLQPVQHLQAWGPAAAGGQLGRGSCNALRVKEDDLWNEHEQLMGQISLSSVFWHVCPEKYKMFFLGVFIKQTETVSQLMKWQKTAAKILEGCSWWWSHRKFCKHWVPCAADGVKRMRLIYLLGAFQREVMCSWNQILHFYSQLREEVRHGLLPSRYSFQDDPWRWIFFLCPRSQSTAAALHEPCTFSSPASMPKPFFMAFSNTQEQFHLSSTVMWHIHSS